MALFFDQEWFEARLAEAGLNRDTVAAALGLSAEQVDEVSGVSRKVIQESPDQEHRPQLVICDEKRNTIVRDNETNAEFNLPVKAELVVEDGQEVHAGDILRRIHNVRPRVHRHELHQRQRR